MTDTQEAEQQLEKDLVTELWAARKESEIKKAELAEANKRVGRVEAKIKDMMIKRDIKSIRITGVGLVTLIAPKLEARCNQANNEKLFAWLDEIDRKDVIKETVHSATLKALVREIDGQGESIPEFIETWWNQVIRFSASK